MRFKWLITIIVFLLVTCSGWALEVPEKPEGYVSDYAGILSAPTRDELGRTLADFERETSNQLVVVTFPSLEGEVLEDFSIRLAEKWKIGTKEKDNGVILLIFKNDRQVRIEVGYGLEGPLPDITASQIIRDEIVPAFRQGDYDGGVTSAVRAIIQQTRGEYAPARNQLAPWSMERYGPFMIIGVSLYVISPVLLYGVILAMGIKWFGFIGFIAGLALCAPLAFFRFWVWSLLFGQTLAVRKKSQFDAFVDGAFGNVRGGGRSGGGWSGGGGGGFSGGGGGSFGGGGASGRW
jgi:uncharacterized protein